MPVHLFFTDTEAVALLALAQRAGFVVAVAELRAGLTKWGMREPIDTLPELSVWYRGTQVDYFDTDLADAMYEGLAEAQRRRVAERRDEAPLFAEVSSEDQGQP